MAQPDVIVIVLDSVRASHLSAYGHKRATTPNIDKLAHESVLYRRAYPAAPWTLPSHASLFTGLYPSEHCADWDTKWLSSQYMTLAQYLRSFGYESASISSNSFISPHTNLASSFDLQEQVSALAGGPSRLIQRDKNYLERRLSQRVMRKLHRQWREAMRPDRGTLAATLSAIRWLSSHNSNHPLFLFLNYMECHLTYKMRYPERFRFLDNTERDYVHKVPQDAWAIMAGKEVITPDQMELLKKLYDGGLYYMDKAIGRLIEALKRSGRYDNSIIVITSDHGENFGERGLMDHQYSVHETVAHIPLIVRFPTGMFPAQQDERLVQLVDVFPTIADLVRGDRDSAPKTSGVSMLGSQQRDTAFIELLAPVTTQFQRRFPQFDYYEWALKKRAVYHGDYKLIWREDNHVELYDLTHDPEETTNLAESDSQRVTAMQSILIEQLGHWPQKDRGIRVSGDLTAIQDQLRALGYL